MKFLLTVVLIALAGRALAQGGNDGWVWNGMQWRNPGHGATVRLPPKNAATINIANSLMDMRGEGKRAARYPPISQIMACHQPQANNQILVIGSNFADSSDVAAKIQELTMEPRTYLNSNSAQCTQWTRSTCQATAGSTRLELMA